jgi:hypothetical protein
MVPSKLWVPHGVFRVDGYIMILCDGDVGTHSEPGFLQCTYSIRVCSMQYFLFD